MEKRPPPIIPFTAQLKVLLPPQDPKDVPLMTAEQVNRIPYKLLAWLWAEAHKVEDHHEIFVLTITNVAHHQVVKRVVQWMVKGEHAAFFANDTLEVIRTDEDDKTQILPYSAKHHRDDTACRAHPRTHGQFVKDVESYQFGAIAGLPEMTSALSKCIRSRYPVYVAEITALLKIRCGPGTATPFDADLSRFVIARMRTLHSLMVEDGDLRTFLRSCFPANEKINALLRYASPDTDTLELAAENIARAVGSITEAKALLATFAEKYLDISDTPAPTGPADRRVANHRTGDAMIVFDAIYRDNRLLVSDQDGRGTMRSTRSGSILPCTQNCDFRVSRGELLVTLPNEKAGTPGFHVVCNRHAEVGELFKQMRLTPLQEKNNDYLPPSSDHRAPPSPTSESDKRLGDKRKRIDSWSRQA